MVMKASDIMTLGTASTTADASLAEAIRCMSDHRISALPVLDREGRLQGIVSEGDFFRPDRGLFRLDALVKAESAERAHLLSSKTVSDIMSVPPVSVDGDASLEETVGIMAQHGVKRLPVMSHGKLVGLISRADILRFLLDR